jgi:hypothetical protein
METSGASKTFAETNWQANGACLDGDELFQVAGVYEWTKLVVRATGGGMGDYDTTYTPNGEIRDHDNNVVGTHNLDIPIITIKANIPTPNPG